MDSNKIGAEVACLMAGFMTLILALNLGFGYDLIGSFGTDGQAILGFFSTLLGGGVVYKSAVSILDMV